ncbi:Hypothetical protein PBC10988_26760 [Planctomycetales bacterium 10988]|nr:Hypothetical protein PBC10988_26760 [Planctomycetales bacterium 10988]
MPALVCDDGPFTKEAGVSNLEKPLSRHLFPTAVFLACMVYAIFRYNVFGEVSPEQIPLFIFNKGASFAGVILLGWSRCEADPRRRRDWGMAGMNLILLHVIISLSLLTPAYFGKFFHSSGMMNWQAETSMLCGTLSFLLLCWLFVATLQEKKKAKAAASTSLLPGAGRTMLLLAGAHVAFMGYAGWLKPKTWHGYLPPITLLSFVVVMIFILSPRLSKKRR